jgi:glycosyltransferase involved in cell wall biosynthesis
VEIPIEPLFQPLLIVIELKSSLLSGVFEYIYSNEVCEVTPMKICIATHHFPPKFIGGAEQYAYRLARHLVQNGNEVEVVTIDSISQGKLEPECQTDHYEGITVHHLSFNVSLANRSLPLLFCNPYLGDWFARYFDVFRPDLLHVNSGYLLGGTVIEEAHARRIPIALTLHEFWFICPLNTLLRTNGQVCEKPVPPARCKWCLMGIKRRYRNLDKVSNGLIGDVFVQIASLPRMHKVTDQDEDIREINDRRVYLHKVFEMVDLVISPSKFLIEKMNSYGFHHSNFMHLPYGLQNVLLEVPQKQRKPGCLRVGYLGRISPEKGIDVLIKSLKLIPTPDISLNIYGHIDEIESYHRYLHNLVKDDPRVQFCGQYNQSELPEILHNLDVTVVPSRWYENRPGTILEAFAHNTPVVASRLGGMIELIQHNVNGLLFTVNDAEDLSRQLRRLISETDLLPHLEKGILPVQRVDEEMKQIDQHYQILTGSASAESSFSNK